MRVLEVANVITGPYCGMILADLGAEVIKVEPPGGDPFRKWDGDAGGGVRPAFAAYNRGKRSLSLDLKTPEGRDTLLALALGSDVIIENSRPGAMERLGLGEEVFREVNPSIIYCYISGMGVNGPDRDRPTYDAVAQAMSGLWSQYVGMEDPEVVGPPMADQLTGMYAATGILAALHRQRFGEPGSRGPRLDVSMLASCLAFQTAGIASYMREGVVPNKSTRALNSQSYAFVGSDNLPFAIHLSTPRKFWMALCRAADRADLAEDKRYQTKAGRVAGYADLQSAFAATFRTRPREHWLGRLRELDVPAAPILPLDEALRSPQVEALAMVTDLADDPALGGLVTSPVAVDGELSASALAPPELDAHADEILSELRLALDDVAGSKVRQVRSEERGDGGNA